MGLDLAVGFQLSITKILADFNLAIQYGIVIHIIIASAILWLHSLSAFLAILAPCLELIGEFLFVDVL